jgi:hypothetical protein
MSKRGTVAMKTMMPVLLLLLFTSALAVSQEGGNSPQAPGGEQETLTQPNKTEQARPQASNAGAAADCGCQPLDPNVGLCRAACDKRKEWDKRDDELRELFARPLDCTNPHDVQNRLSSIASARGALTAMSAAYQAHYDADIADFDKAITDAGKFGVRQDTLSKQTRARLEGAQQELQDDQTKFRQLMADPDESGARSRVLEKLKKIIDSDQEVIGALTKTLSVSEEASSSADTVIDRDKALRSFVVKYKEIKDAEAALYDAVYDGRSLRIDLECPPEPPPKPEVKPID